MKNNNTELVFILDKSGSMCGLTDDTIGGFNSMIEKQRAENAESAERGGEVFVTTVLFSTESVTLHDRLPLAKVPEMTRRDYQAAGGTALLDAVGDTIAHIEAVHRYIRAEDVTAHTLVVITTDGEENSSRRYSQPEIKRTVERKQADGWQFVFLGANIDAVAAARDCGIRPENAVRCWGDGKGTRLGFVSASRAASSVRSDGAVEESWAEDSDAYYDIMTTFSKKQE